MRSSAWLVGVSLLMTVAAIAVAGCGSSGAGNPDSSIAVMTGDGGGHDVPADAGTADSGPGCTPVGVSGATVDAGALWGCFEQACASALAACAAECACNNAVVAALGCVGTGGSQLTCFMPVAGAGTNGLSVVSCLLTSTSGCGVSIDAGDAAGQ